MSKQKTTPKYSTEVRERAIGMVREYAGEHTSQWAAIVSIAAKIGCTPQTLHNWVVQAERDRDLRGGVTTDGRARMKALERSFGGLRGGTRVGRSVSQYGGSARLDYRDADQEAIGADQGQLNFTLTGPTYDRQSETRGYGTVDLTWRRRLSKDIVSVLNATDVLASRVRTNGAYTDDYVERATRQSPGARVRLTLTYQFGDPAKRQQEPAHPSISGG